MAGKETIFTKFLRDLEKRNKAMEKAGGGKKGKRLKAKATIPEKKKGK